MELQRPREAAALTLSLLDLTNLKEDCTPEQIAALCQRAHTEYGNTAAICIWPRFVAQARAAFGKDHAIRIATVVNFPSGDLDVANVVAETEAAIRDGADEIDLVIPYRKFIAGDESAVSTMVAAVRKACAAPVLLKVILETGELKDKALIRRASEITIAEGPISSRPRPARSRSMPRWKRPTSCCRRSGTAGKRLASSPPAASVRWKTPRFICGWRKPSWRPTGPCRPPSVSALPASSTTY